MKKTYKSFVYEECSLVLPDSHQFIEAILDRIAICLCYRWVCVEVKRPYSINLASLKNAELPFIEKKNDQFKFKWHIIIISTVCYKWQSKI